MRRAGGPAEGEGQGHPPTGRHVSAESAEVFRIVDGMFTGYWCLANVARLMRQLTEEPLASAELGRCVVNRRDRPTTGKER